MAARRSFWCVRLSDSRRNRRCTRASASASRPPWRACNDASSGRKSRSTAAPPSVRSDACSAATHAPPRAMRSVSSTTKSCRLACGSNGRGAPNGTTGRITAKAAMCCAPICATGAPRRCGGPISSFPKRKRPFASIKASCRSVPSGISARTACWRTSWCAFSPTCCGRRWSNGRAAPVSATVRAPFSRNSAITSTDVILPTAASPGRELRLRCVVRPDRAQAVLLERLGLRLPEQLRTPRAARTM